MDTSILTQVLVSPVLMLMMWKHSVGPCDKGQMDAVAFLDAFLDMALNGLLPQPASQP